MNQYALLYEPTVHLIETVLYGITLHAHELVYILLVSCINLCQELGQHDQPRETDF
jgi:hypothetical protein